MLRTAYRVLPCSRSRKPETRRNLRKSLRAVWKYSGTAGNLFTQFGNALERAEISSRNFGMRWNLRKSLRAVWECAGTSGDSFPQFGNMLERVEILSRGLETCRNLRKLSQRNALLTEFYLAHVRASRNVLRTARRYCRTIPRGT